jgi:glycyl-tRNA synthetase
VMAPVKCAVLPLSKNEKFNDLISDLSSALSLAGLINRIDDGGQSIGRRYARADELGTPFGITVDFASLEDKSVTVRERDSTLQIRCGVEDAVRAIGDMVSERKTWKEVRSLYPAFSSWWGSLCLGFDRNLYGYLSALAEFVVQELLTSVEIMPTCSKWNM